MVEQFWSRQKSNKNRMGYMNQVNFLLQLRHDMYNRVVANDYLKNRVADVIAGLAIDTG